MMICHDAVPFIAPRKLETRLLAGSNEPVDVVNALEGGTDVDAVAPPASGVVLTTGVGAGVPGAPGAAGAVAPPLDPPDDGPVGAAGAAGAGVGAGAVAMGCA